MAGVKNVGGAKSAPGLSVPKDGEGSRQKAADVAGQTGRKAADAVVRLRRRPGWPARFPAWRPARS